MATRPPPPGSSLLGMAFVLSGNVFACGVLGLFSGFANDTVQTWALRGMMAPGVTQLVWALPLALLFLLLRRRYTVIGMVVMAGLVFLANGAAWGLMAGGMLGGGE